MLYAVHDHFWLRLRVERHPPRCRAGTVSSRSFHSRKFESRVSNPRTIAYLNLKSPSKVNISLGQGAGVELQALVVQRAAGGATARGRFPGLHGLNRSQIMTAMYYYYYYYHYHY